MVAIRNIAPGNGAIEFIEQRIADDNYRGADSSQHNRYNMQELFDTLAILNQYTDTDGFLRIRDTDLSKRPVNTPDEYRYAEFCDAVKRKIGQGTQDSIRKNRFVDWALMGFIERYDISKQPIRPGQSTKYVGLTADCINFINEPDILNRLFRYTKGIYKRSPQIEHILEILSKQGKFYGI